MPTEEHHYHGPVIHGDVRSSQLAWGNEKVVQNLSVSKQIAPGFEDVARVVADVVRRLGELGLPEPDARDAAENADAVLAEVVKPEPDRGIVRRGLTALKGTLAQLATGLLAGAHDGAVQAGKELVHALGQLTF
ncbi:hypothetical protein [Amycolatopsis sp. NPDC051903]|uniref:hypothetical protein n=1 Tax=Amycolatopsis sp. NPDC051903 TaxID=3363936 RepID=UPI0037B9748E